MKKLVFTAQVFSLIAMFPIVAVLEMTHAKSGFSKRNSSYNVVQKPAKTNILLHEKVKAKMADEVFPITLETFFLKKAF
jgi:hypothetical protein